MVGGHDRGGAFGDLVHVPVSLRICARASQTPLLTLASGSRPRGHHTCSRPSTLTPSTRRYTSFLRSTPPFILRLYRRVAQMGLTCQSLHRSTIAAQIARLSR